MGAKPRGTAFSRHGFTFRPAGKTARRPPGGWSGRLAPLLLSILVFRKAALVSLVLLGLSGCRQIEKITGAPYRLDNAEAAAKYLDIVCPSNFEFDKLNQEYKKKGKQADAGELAIEEWGKFVDSHLLASASRIFRSAQAKTNPRFIWPESVRSLVAEMSAAEMEIVSAYRDFVRDGGLTAASKEEGPWPDSPGKDANQRAADKASAIRTSLRLPPRSEGCKNGKRSLTLEQIGKLQGA